MTSHAQLTVPVLGEALLLQQSALRTCDKWAQSPAAAVLQSQAIPGPDLPDLEVLMEYPNSTQGKPAEGSPRGTPGTWKELPCSVHRPDFCHLQSQTFIFKALYMKRGALWTWAQWAED